MQEKRRSARWSVGRQAQFKLFATDDYRQCVLVDISFGGCQIISNEDLSPGSRTEFVISLPYLDPIVTETRVVWQKEETFRKRQGLQFTRIGDFDKEKIFLYVRDNYRKELIKRWWEGVR